MILRKYPKNDYTLDGEKNKIKTKRKYLLKDDNFFVEIKNSDLLPGDVIYLKSNDIVPCDCIIIEGDCLANISDLTGNLDTFKKTSLKSNNEEFNYKFNNINILYHGMKIIKTFSKLKESYISAICINTGPNTYKANLYANILYYLEGKKEYIKDYSFLGNRKIIILINMLISFILSAILGFVFYYQFKFDFNILSFN